MTSIARLAIPAFMLLPTQVFAQYRGAPAPVDPGHTRLAFAAVYALRYTRVEERSIVLPDGDAHGRFESDYGTGLGASVLAEVRATRALRGMAAFTFLDRAGGVTERDATGETRASLPASRFVLATVGVALRLSEHSPGYQETNLYTAFRIGPTYALELSRGAVGTDQEGRAMATWGVGLGIEAEAPIGKAAAFQLGIEDHVLFANQAELARRLNEDFARAGVNAYANVTSPASHVLLLRAGFAFTFH